MEHTSLFITPQEESTAILVIDASGSVKKLFHGKVVFRKFQEIIERLPVNQFQIVFWNSDTNHQNFPGGIKKFPFVITQATLNQAFTMVDGLITDQCLTNPHLGFRAIKDWLAKGFSRTVYFLTDGQINGNLSVDELHRHLAQSITDLISSFPEIQIKIITVEPLTRDFSNIEALSGAAGCDVYNVISGNRLTKAISSFTSYTLNYPDGHTHLNQVRTPPGHLPFRGSYFSERLFSQFIDFLVGEISRIPRDDEGQLIRLIQELSGTLAMYVKDKPKAIREAILSLFSSLFQNTMIDPVMIQFILTDSIASDQLGSASLYSTYRSQLKDLFRRAGQLVQQDVKTAVEIHHKYVTLPFQGRLVTGPAQSITQDLAVRNVIYHRGCVKLNDVLLPVIPLDFQVGRGISEQCLRQWIRIILGHQYLLDPTSDQIMYLMMSFNLQTFLSGLQVNLRPLVQTMFLKKRLNSDITELARLMNNELPTPNNGRIEDFYAWMGECSRRLKMPFRPFTMWYLLCVAYDETLAERQVIHCREDLAQDFSGVLPHEVINHLIQRGLPEEVRLMHLEAPIENTLDYQCLVTLSDTSLTGGYRFLPHLSRTGMTCCPIQVLSEEGYLGVLRSNVCVCPICFANLTDSSFELTPPRTQSETRMFPEGTISPFSEIPTMRSVPTSHNPPVSVAVAVNSTTQRAPAFTVLPSIGKNGKLIVMKGVVGCGKSTLSEKIRERVTQRGGKCWVEGTDKYCQHGEPFGSAKSKVYSSLLEAMQDSSDDKVIVLDTCGDSFKKQDVFGHNLSHWKIINVWPNLKDRRRIREYLAWSLRNVLQRQHPGTDGNYYLSPVGSDLKTCISVHLAKTRKLFGKGTTAILSEFTPSVEIALQMLKESADTYQTYLASQSNSLDHI